MPSNKNIDSLLAFLNWLHTQYAWKSKLLGWIQTNWKFHNFYSYSTLLFVGEEKKSLHYNYFEWGGLKLLIKIIS